MAAEKLFLTVDRESVDLSFCVLKVRLFSSDISLYSAGSVKIKKEHRAFDFNLGCSGFVYGLGIAKSLSAQKLQIE